MLPQVERSQTALPHCQSLLLRSKTLQLHEKKLLFRHHCVGVVLFIAFMDWPRPGCGVLWLDSLHVMGAGFLFRSISYAPVGVLTFVHLSWFVFKPAWLPASVKISWKGSAIKGQLCPWWCIEKLCCCLCCLALRDWSAPVIYSGPYWLQGILE